MKSGQRHAIVIGAGLAGILAAAALAPHVDRVTVIDKDRLPDGPHARRGLPQARHAHLLWSGGARVIESLAPGAIARLIAAGAHRVGLPDGLVSLSAQGWLRRWPEMEYLITCSRDLLDWVLRQHVLASDHIRVQDGMEVLDLVRHGDTVHGVTFRDTASGATAQLTADLVVDASGRASNAPRWLAQLGFPPVAEDVVDSGLAYASRIFRAPVRACKGFPVVNVQADPRATTPGQTATILPIENGLWLVTLSGTRGGEPPRNNDAFIPFARSVRHPVVGELIAATTPVSPVYFSRSTANRRHRFEKLRHWPPGFLVIGDAVATYNPVYGQGMSVAAQCAATLSKQLDRYGVHPGTTIKIQREISRTIEPAWLVATGQDILYPGAVGPAPTLPAKLMQRYLERLIRTATSEPRAARILFSAFTLSAPMTRLLSPTALLTTLRGPTAAPLTEPPLTAEELQLVR